MEKKFERVWELLKDWYDLGLINRKMKDININFDGTEYEVLIVELGAYEYSSTLEGALDKHIKELENDDDYIRALWENEQENRKYRGGE